MLHNVDYTFVQPWHNGRCTICIDQRNYTINHVFLPGRKKAAFACNGITKNSFSGLVSTLAKKEKS